MWIKLCQNTCFSRCKALGQFWYLKYGLLGRDLNKWSRFQFWTLWGRAAFWKRGDSYHLWLLYNLRTSLCLGGFLKSEGHWGRSALGFDFHSDFSLGRKVLYEWRYSREYQHKGMRILSNLLCSRLVRLLNSSYLLNLSDDLIFKGPFWCFWMFRLY